MNHPQVFRPNEQARFDDTKMGKATLFESERLLVGLNCFEPGQEHQLHTHQGMDKVYYVLEGAGLLLLDGHESPLRAGDMVVTPAGLPHGIRNNSTERLVLLAVLAPTPKVQSTGTARSV